MVAFTAMLYLAVDAASLAAIGVYSVARGVLTNLAAAALLAVTAWRARDQGWRPLELASGALAVALLSGTVSYLLPPDPSWPPSLYFAWFPPEWHQAPMVFLTFFLSFWVIAAIWFAAFALFAVLHIIGRHLPLLLFNAAAVAVFAGYALTTNDDAARLLPVLAPSAAAVLFGLARQRLIERRVAALGAPFALAFANYVALLPPTLPDVQMPGLERVFPREGVEVPRLPGELPSNLAHMRDVLVDEAGERMFISYGATCGVIRVDLPSGRAEVCHASLTRFLQLSDDGRRLYGGGWLDGTLMEFSTEPLALIRAESLQPMGLGSVFKLERRGGSGYASSYNPPVFARFDFDTLEPLAVRDFREGGYTKLPCGPAHFVFSPDGRRIYLSIGMVNVPAAFSIVELDAETLEVLRTIPVPELPLKILYDAPSKHLVVSSFYSDRIFELDLASGEVRSVHHGELHSRVLLLDDQRDWLIAGSYYNGYLSVLERSTSTLLFRQRIATRLQFARLYEDSGRVYITSDGAVFRLDLPTLEYHIRKTRP
jgi:hypothetical protein